MLRSTSAVLSFLLLWSGCAAKPLDVTGTWVMTEESRRTTPGMQEAAGKIVLAYDGTFTASEVSDPEVFGRTGLVSGGGMWELTTENGNQVVRLVFSEINREKRSFDTYLNIDGIRTLSLFYFRGDPDSGERVYFERKK